MARRINYVNAENAQQAYENAKTKITPEKIEKFKVSADLDYNDGDLTITATGKGFTLNVEFLEDHMNMHLKLSFLLKAVQSKIEDSLERELVRIV